MTGFKRIDTIFYYPGVMPDQVIERDLFRSFLKKRLDYDAMCKRSDILFVFPTSVKKAHTQELIEQNRDKKIVFVYWAENIFGYFRLMSQVHAVLKKFNLSSSFVDNLLFNPVAMRLLSLYSPIQVDTYFKHIVEEARPNHFFILTNTVKANAARVFFAPYFYYFCQTHVRKILSRSFTNSEPRKFCAFIVSNPNNLDRITFFKKLSRYKQVDSFGKVLNNKSLSDLNKDHVIGDYQLNDLVYEQYKFVICFENSYAEGYITEKIINAIAGGAVPIYRGAPDVGKYFNAARIVDYNSCDQSYDKMIEMIKALDQDEQRYKEFVNQPVFSRHIEADLTEHDNRLATFIESVLATKSNG